MVKDYTNTYFFQQFFFYSCLIWSYKEQLATSGSCQAHVLLTCYSKPLYRIGIAANLEMSGALKSSETLAQSAKKTFIGEKHLRQHYLLMTTDCTDCLHLEYLPEICILMARREITHKLLLKNVWMAQLSLPCGSGGGLRKQPVRRAWADGHLAARQQLY